MATEVISRTETLTPGLYPDIPADDYHRWQAASQTLLKIMRDRSPAHAREHMINPPPSTPAQRLGTAVHTAILQPDLFAIEYACAPDVDRRTREGKAEWAEFVEAHPNATILSADDYDLCLRLRDAVWTHPIAPKLLVGDVEQSVVWHDKGTGVLCKGRFDALNTKVGALTDVKTTIDASPRSFTRSIYRYGYYMQAAHYLAGAYAHGIDLRYSTIIAVEKEPPYAVAVYHIRDEAVAAGEDELRQLLETWAACEATGVWPGYPETATEISLPPWAWYELKEGE